MNYGFILNPKDNNYTVCISSDGDYTCSQSTDNCCQFAVDVDKKDFVLRGRSANIR